MIKVWIILLAFLLCGHQSIDTMPLQETRTMQYKITGEGKPLVLVPGGLTGWVSWDSFVPVFSKNKKVVQVQLLSVQYGLENNALPENYSVTTEREALEAALASVDLKEKADFIGWSYGGMVLLDYALNNPDKIRTLTLIEPPTIWIVKSDLEKDPELKKVKDFLSAVPGMGATISEEDLEKFLAFAGFSKPGESIRDLPQWNAWLNFRQSLRSNSVVLKHNDNPERLRKFPAPVLLVKGTGSAYFLHRIMDECAKQFPNARIVEFAGGHAPHLVSRDRFLEELESFQR